MKFGGYFPVQTDRARFSQVVNAGTWDDISDFFGGSDDSTSGGGDDRGFFERGNVVQVDERSLGTSQGTEFLQGTSGADRAIGNAATGFVGALTGIPGATTALRGLAGDNTVRQVDANGNPISGGASNSGDNNSFQNQAGANNIATQSNIPVTVNEQGQLVDNSGNLVNQQGQRVDENGRVMSDSTIAIRDALARQEISAERAQQLLQQSETDARQVSVDAALASQGFVQQGAVDASAALDTGLTNSIDRTNAALERGIGVDNAALERGLGIDRAQTAQASTLIGNSANEQLAAQRTAATNSLDFLQSGADQGIAERRNQLDAITADLDPTINAGNDATAANRAFLGLDGVGEQQRAFDNFIASPGQIAEQEQGQQALLRAQNATGGVQSGLVQQELMRQGQNYANTRLGDRLDRLTALSSTGLNAANSLGNFRTSAASGIAGDLNNLGVNQSNVSSNLGNNESNIIGTRGINQANLASGLGQRQGSQVINQGQTQSGQILGVGQNQAQLTSNNAVNQANVAGTLAGQQADLSTNLGTLQTNLISNTGTNVANLAQLTGENQSNAILGQQVATATAETNANQIAAQQAAQKSEQDAAFNRSLLGLGSTLLQGSDLFGGSGGVLSGLGFGSGESFF